MIAKMIRGKSFAGVLRYILDEGPKATGKKNPNIVGGNVFGRTAAMLAKEFNAVSRLRPDIEKAVEHVALSSPPGENLSDDQWQMVAEDFLTGMGVDTQFTPHILVRHQDADHDHIHLVFSRVNEKLCVWLGQWEAKKAIEQCRIIEQKYGLTQVVEKRREKRRVSSKEINKAIRTGQEPPRTKLQRIIDEALHDAPTGTEFLRRLEVAGVEVKSNMNSKGVNGLSFAIDGLAFSGSKLGADYKWSSLLKRGLNYEQVRDFGAFEGRRAVREDASVSIPDRGNVSGVDRVEGTNPEASPRAGRVEDILNHRDGQIHFDHQSTNPTPEPAKAADSPFMDWDYWPIDNRSAHDVSVSSIVHTRHTHRGFIDPEFAISRFKDIPVHFSSHPGVVDSELAVTRVKNVPKAATHPGVVDSELAVTRVKNVPKAAAHPGVVDSELAVTRVSGVALAAMAYAMHQQQDKRYELNGFRDYLLWEQAVWEQESRAAYNEIPRGVHDEIMAAMAEEHAYDRRPAALNMEYGADSGGFEEYPGYTPTPTPWDS